MSPADAAGMYGDDGVMVLGRTTWQLFSRLWPGRDDPFSARMNAVPKLVVSRTLTDASAWTNSRVIDGDLADTVKREQRDVIVTGSLSVVRALMADDLIDEYRLLTFPTILGTGERLFPRRWVTHLPGVPVGRAGRRRRPHAVRDGGAMTVCFLAPHETPAGPEVRIPLGRRSA
jgi:dihydrofolate reductase